jgi:hypothetical protein
MGIPSSERFWPELGAAATEPWPMTCGESGHIAVSAPQRQPETPM